MEDRHHHPDSSDASDSSPHEEPSKCPCGCQPEAVYVAELQQDYARILPELCRLGEVLCFARNRHCIVGSMLALPDMQGTAGYFKGATSCTDFHLDTTQWRYAYSVHEYHKHRGTFMGLEFFDQNHRALFRMFLSPDSEQRELQDIVHNFHRRGVPLDELSAWHRMGRMGPAPDARHVTLSQNFAQADVLSRPFDGKQVPLDDEMGFDGHLPLMQAVLSDAHEDNQRLGITVAGGFGRMALAFTPHMIERISEDWIYVGEPGYALRMNLGAVATYWIGCYREGGQNFSYLEAVDALGDLIVRVTSTQAESYRYWQLLAAGM